MHWPPLHTEPPPQVPQSSTWLQPSEINPHSYMRAAHVRGMHGSGPHPFGPPPPQFWPAGQVPQVTVAPHPSRIVPQLAPTLPQVVATQPQMCGATPPQTSGSVQAPQVSMPPHPSGTTPHAAPSVAHVAATQGATLHLPPLQFCPVGHVPQLIVAPQPSGIEPHTAAWAAHVVFVHPHWLGVPAPPHVSGRVQAPHCSCALHPSEIKPQLSPALAQVRVGLQPPLSAVAEAHRLGPAAPPPHVCPAGHVPQSSVLPHASAI
jgi:hypothetical protein